MKYKEFKEKIKDWGEKYNYKPVIQDSLDYIYMMFLCKDRYRKVFTIDKSERFFIDLNWELYRNLSDDEKRDLFEIITEFAATKPEDREGEKDNLDLIINRLEVIQANAEDVMNWTIQEIQERSWNLRNTLEDIIIDLEEYKEKQELPYEITDMQGMFAINNTDMPF